MRGRNMRVNSRKLDFSNNNIRTHFMAPPVDPAHAPININKTKRKRHAFGHKSKSVEA